MSPVPFVERPYEPAWFYCADCSAMYDGRLGHECPAGDPLRAAKGTFRPFLVMLVIYVLLLVALDAKLGWPVR